MDALTSLADTAPEKLDRVLDTGSARALAIWHDVLTLQVDHFLPAEVAAFGRSPAWQRAESVLEAGCGNGRYLAGLSRAFPDKHYLGVDVSEGLVALAGEQHADPRTDFHVADFLAADEEIGRFDAVVMRFVVQHMADFVAVLRRAAACLNPGGSLFIIEPDLTRSGNTPPTPAFAGMLAEFGAQAAARTRLRVQLDALPGLITAVPGWHVARHEQLGVLATGPFSGGNLPRLYEAWTALCENQGTFSCDFAAVRRELRAWSGLTAASSRIGLTMIEARHHGDVDEPASQQ